LWVLLPGANILMVSFFTSTPCKSFTVWQATQDLPEAVC